jgi:hypothetical protein
MTSGGSARRRPRWTDGCAGGGSTHTATQVALMDAPCPRCGAVSALRHDSAGDEVPGAHTVRVRRDGRCERRLRRGMRANPPWPTRRACSTAKHRPVSSSLPRPDLCTEQGNIRTEDISMGWKSQRAQISALHGETVGRNQSPARGSGVVSFTLGWPRPTRRQRSSAHIWIIRSQLGMSTSCSKGLEGVLHNARCRTHRNHRDKPKCEISWSAP